MSKTEKAMSAFERWYHGNRRLKLAKKSTSTRDAEVKKFKVQCRMVDPHAPQHSSLNTVIRTVKVSAENEAAAKERAIAYYKKLGYRRIDPYLVTTADVADGPFSEMLAKILGVDDSQTEVDIPPMVGKQEGFGKDVIHRGYSRELERKNPAVAKAVQRYRDAYKAWASAGGRSEGAANLREAEAEANRVIEEALNSPARGVDAKDATFDSAHWVKDRVFDHSYTGMRGDWFLFAKRTKDGKHWVAYAEHKDSKERRIGGGFKKVGDAQQAAARLPDLPSTKDAKRGSFFTLHADRYKAAEKSGAVMTAPPAAARHAAHIKIIAVHESEQRGLRGYEVTWEEADTGSFKDKAKDALKTTSEIRKEISTLQDQLRNLRGSDPEEAKRIRDELDELREDLKDMLEAERSR